jgi:hypothetical protein
MTAWKILLCGAIGGSVPGSSLDSVETPRSGEHSCAVSCPRIVVAALAWLGLALLESPNQPSVSAFSPTDNEERYMLSRVATLVFVALAAAVGQFSLLRAEESTRLTDLTIAKAERMVFEGRNGIKITFDGPSAERLRQFTRDFVGRRIVVLVNQRRLATALLLAPIVNGNILVAGDLDSLASEALFSADAVLTLEIERPEPSK